MGCDYSVWLGNEGDESMELRACELFGFNIGGFSEKVVSGHLAFLTHHLFAAETDFHRFVSLSANFKAWARPSSVACVFDSLLTWTWLQSRRSQFALQITRIRSARFMVLLNLSLQTIKSNRRCMQPLVATNTVMTFGYKVHGVCWFMVHGVC